MTPNKAQALLDGMNGPPLYIASGDVSVCVPDLLRAYIAQSEEIERLRGAVSWLEPPFVTAETPADEIRTRISFCLADLSRATLKETGNVG